MMDALSHPDRDVLSAMGLEPLYCLRRVAVNENMSWAAARNWDSRDPARVLRQFHYEQAISKLERERWIRAQQASHRLRGERVEVSQAAGAFRLQLTDDFTPAPEYVTWLRKRVETNHGGSGGNKEEVLSTIRIDC
ncbi:hypothetical protein GH714_042437 [Hevea brasiliensis]|uniref:Uncharacterized protein n=1 Tax=Hevea brasiliensis TaxID=3981 RepID=A0A6A6KM39_HEVBR|nr:hypothetical protein GH714_042437 [Hevea brasiliensis]